MPLSHLEALLNPRLLGTIPEFLIQYVWAEAWESAFLTGSDQGSQIYVMMTGFPGQPTYLCSSLSSLQTYFLQEASLYWFSRNSLSSPSGPFLPHFVVSFYHFPKKRVLSTNQAAGQRGKLMFLEDTQISVAI